MSAIKKLVYGVSFSLLGALGCTPPGDDSRSPIVDETRAEWASVPADAPEGTGFLRIGARRQPQPVSYAIVKGEALFEGDIHLGSVEAVERESQRLRASLSGEVSAQGVGIPMLEYRWPGAVIPYTIDPALPNQSRITAAIQHWQERTPLRFVQRTATNAASYPDYVTFVPSTGCSSYVGRQGGPQPINLADGCTTGNTIHEIGHAVGLWHEQSREDRDGFVRIRWENIQSGTEHNFHQHLADGEDLFGYDFGSIMHYGAYAFSKNNLPTIETLGGQSIGQRAGLSSTDIASATSLYPTVAAYNMAPGLVVLQHETRRRLGLWAVDGTHLTYGSEEQFTPEPDWRAVSTCDLNADGNIDIVLQNTSTRQIGLWTTDGKTVLRRSTVNVMPGVNWLVAGAGDFNADGRPDILLQHEWTRALVVWMLDGDFVTASSGVSHTPEPGWRAVAVSDLNRDGRADILLQHENSEVIGVWLMNGVNVAVGTSLSARPGAGWKVAGVEDFNADGRPDVLLQTWATRGLAVWLLNGTDVVGGGLVDATPGEGWRAISRISGGLGF